MSSVKVLIVDDSNLMRRLLSSIVSKDSRLQVVGTAENGADALQKIKDLKPDVVTLDLNMPVMDGMSTLREAKAQKLPPTFLVVSSLAQRDAQCTIDAINEGAIDYIPKPSQMMGMGALENEIVTKILVCYEAKLRNNSGADQASEGSSSPSPAAQPSAPVPEPPVSVQVQQRSVASASPGASPTTSPTASPPASPVEKPIGEQPPPKPQVAPATSQTVDSSAAPAVTPSARPSGPPSRPRINVFGGSAGSMQVLQKLTPQVPATFSGVAVFVLHLPAFFTTQLAIRLKETCAVPVEEAKDGMPLALRRIYIAPGGTKNLVIVRNPAGKGVVFKLVDNDKGGPTPSIDAFMSSAAEIFRDACRGILISGTGTDGIEGLRRVKERQGEVFVQDKSTALANQLVIAAVDDGVVEKTLRIPEIAALFA